MCVVVWYAHAVKVMLYDSIQWYGKESFLLSNTSCIVAGGCSSDNNYFKGWEHQYLYVFVVNFGNKFKTED